MALELTLDTDNVLLKTEIQPQIVLEIDGVPNVYTGVEIRELIRVGDPGLLIGDDWVIGGSNSVQNQENLLMLKGTSTDISQQLAPERGAVSSVSSMKICLIDKNDKITQLITPGEVVDDILGRRARVWLGFKGTSYPEDFVTVFRGIVDDIVSDQGFVVLNIAHPDQKKRNSIYERAETELDGAINDSVATITVQDTSKFLVGINGPDGNVDDTFTGYIQIDDEIIKYTGKTSTTFTGCVRGQLGSVASAHDDEAAITSFYRLTGNGVEIALKLMLSGWGGNFEEGVQPTSFGRTNATDLADNAILFSDINMKERYGINEGDYITTSGASNGANNVSLKQILTIEITDAGTYILVDDVTFVLEDGTTGVVAFRSQYDTLPSGLKMHGDEVDVEGHLLWYRRYLSGFEFDHYLKDTIEGKEFIEKENYLPMGAYSLPRRARSSMGYHSTPIPTDEIVTLNDKNVTNPMKIKLRRSIGKNFYNTIIYKIEMDSLQDKYLFGHIKTDADSKNRIAVGNKPLVIEAGGMRRSLLGASLAETAATRLLQRYKFGAEFIDQIEVLFSVGFKIEVGDVVLLDGANLNISDTVNAERGAAPRFYEVINKKIDLRSGLVSLSIVNTGYSTTNRYGLISPASKVAIGTSQSVFTLKPSFNQAYGSNEGRKWSRYVGEHVRVRNGDFSVSGEAHIQSVVGNKVTLDNNLGFTPLEDYVLELTHYNDQSALMKLLYTFMTDNPQFDDGEDQYLMI